MFPGALSEMIIECRARSKQKSMPVSYKGNMYLQNLVFKNMILIQQGSGETSYIFVFTKEYVYIQSICAYAEKNVVQLYIIYLILKGHCSICYRINTPRKQGGLGPIRIPLLSDLTHHISKDYGVYLEDSGHTLRYLSVISHDDKLKLICNP